MMINRDMMKDDIEDDIEFQSDHLTCSTTRGSGSEKYQNPSGLSCSHCHEKVTYEQTTCSVNGALVHVVSNPRS